MFDDIISVILVFIIGFSVGTYMDLKGPIIHYHYPVVPKYEKKNSREETRNASTIQITNRGEQKEI